MDVSGTAWLSSLWHKLEIVSKAKALENTGEVQTKDKKKKSM